MTTIGGARTRTSLPWSRIFLIGLVLWVATAVVTFALTLTLLITEGESYQPTPNGWIVEPTAEQARLFPALEWAGLALVSMVGIAWLVGLWRRTSRPYRIGDAVGAYGVDAGWVAPNAGMFHGDRAGTRRS